MMKVVTIDREYGSGAPVIAQKLAHRLNWKLWDQLLTREIARLTDSELAVVQRLEERKDPLYYRLFKAFLRGSFEANLQVQRLKLLDAESILKVTEQVVREAAAEGNCVIVGRGSQHFLQDFQSAYHVFIYALREEKIRRERETGKTGAQARQLVDTVDEDRAAYIKKYFGKDWPNRHLYHLMVNSRIGDEAAVETILAGMAILEKDSER